jgi:energy-converting hydrogenase Eha subunit H
MSPFYYVRVAGWRSGVKRFVIVLLLCVLFSFCEMVDALVSLTSVAQ